MNTCRRIVLWMSSVSILLTHHSHNCLDNGLALTPPMGWLSWTRFMCEIDCSEKPKHCISQDLFLDMADILVKEGYAAAGYNRVNVDDCYTTRTRWAENDILMEDPFRFKDGIHGLSKQIHKRGLKFGIYTNFGKTSCMGYLGTEMKDIKTDADTFADWEADMVKFDACFNPPAVLEGAYRLMGESLNKTGRPMVYSCSWPYYLFTSNVVPPYDEIVERCNLWRNYHDIGLSFGAVMGIIDFYDKHIDEFAKYHGPGHWNDPDMIIIGNPNITLAEAKVQMGFWCIWAAPLLMSNDLRDMAPGHKDLLLNKELISINQDPLGIMGTKVFQTNSIWVYLKRLQSRSGSSHSPYAILLFNHDRKLQASITFRLSDILQTSIAGTSTPSASVSSTCYTVSESFSHNTEFGTWCLSSEAESITVNLEPIGVRMFKLLPVGSPLIDDIQRLSSSNTSFLLALLPLCCLTILVIAFAVRKGFLPKIRIRGSRVFFFCCY